MCRFVITWTAKTKPLSTLLYRLLNDTRGLCKKHQKHKKHETQLQGDRGARARFDTLITEAVAKHRQHPGRQHGQQRDRSSSSREKRVGRDCQLTEKGMAGNQCTRRRFLVPRPTLMGGQ